MTRCESCSNLCAAYRRANSWEMICTNCNRETERIDVGPGHSRDVRITNDDYALSVGDIAVTIYPHSYQQENVGAGHRWCGKRLSELPAKTRVLARRWG